MSTKHMLITLCGVLPRKKHPDRGLWECVCVCVYVCVCACLKCESITGLRY